MSDKHPTDIDGRPVEELARKVADLRYDKLDEFLTHLADYLVVDADKDQKAGRPMLALHIINVSIKSLEAASHAQKLWSFAEQYMDENDK